MSLLLWHVYPQVKGIDLRHETTPHHMGRTTDCCKRQTTLRHQTPTHRQEASARCDAGSFRFDHSLLPPPVWRKLSRYLSQASRRSEPGCASDLSRATYEARPDLPT